MSSSISVIRNLERSIDGMSFHPLPLPVIDLRLPIGLRVSYTPDVPSGFSERVTVTGPVSAQYRSEWKYAVNFTLGAVLFF